jgi:hypothetical protein
MLEEKPNISKNISPTFKYLTLFYKLSQILGPIASSFQKHDYNNLAFEIHENKS